MRARGTPAARIGDFAWIACVVLAALGGAWVPAASAGDQERGVAIHDWESQDAWGISSLTIVRSSTGPIERLDATGTAPCAEPFAQAAVFQISTGNLAVAADGTFSLSGAAMTNGQPFGSASVSGRFVDGNARATGTIRVTGDAGPAMGLVVACTVDHGPVAFTTTCREDSDCRAPAVPRPPAANRPPVAKPDSYLVHRTGVFSLVVLRNDRDPEGGELRIVSATKPRTGRVACDGVGCDYYPAASFGQRDSFRYTVADEKGAKATATVTVRDPNPRGKWGVQSANGGPVPTGFTLEAALVLNGVRTTLGGRAPRPSDHWRYQLIQANWPMGARLSVAGRTIRMNANHNDDFEPRLVYSLRPAVRPPRLPAGVRRGTISFRTKLGRFRLPASVRIAGR
jgi:hypothetical protein